MRNPATGLAPAPLDGMRWDRFAVQDAIGTVPERREIDIAHGYDVDAVLAASSEFRRAVGGVPFPFMVRGEALHIVRALAAVRDLDGLDDEQLRAAVAYARLHGWRTARNPDPETPA